MTAVSDCVRLASYGRAERHQEAEQEPSPIRLGMGLQGLDDTPGKTGEGGGVHAATSTV
jgi:hypothetical protein